VFVRVPVGPDVRGRDVQLEVHPTRLSLRVQGKPLLEGPVEGAGGAGAGAAIDVDGCFFTVEAEGDAGRHVLLTLAKRTPGYMSWPELLEADKADDTVTRRCWLDVAFRDGDADGKSDGAATQERRGRLVLGLYGNACPRTVANFVALCTGEQREDKKAAADPSSAKSRDALHYLGVPFHRIIDGFMAQTGDTTFFDGTGGLSIYGDSFEDEPQGLRLKHEGRGVLACANAGPDTNSSQVYLTFRATPHLDGKHVVFGRVEAGGEVLAALEAIGTPSGQPRGRAVIVGCGAMPEGATEEEGVALAGQLPLREVDGDGEEEREGREWMWRGFGGQEGEEEEGGGGGAQ
jgi:cyclophilin family peptidyl-prolyl cis-trans isomerase